MPVPIIGAIYLGAVAYGAAKGIKAVKKIGVQALDSLSEAEDESKRPKPTGAKLFDEILAKGVRAGELPARSTAARTWYRDQAKKTRIAPQTLIKSDRDRLVSKPNIGRMYHFFYDPKHKLTLPYYDRFPLVFPFKKVKGGFLGINMHYLALPLRAKLMDALYSIASDRRYNENTKLKITYDLLNSSSKYKYFKPCVKHYLMPHLKSRFFEVYSTEWDIALFLPTEKFVGAPKAKVHKESRMKV